MRSLFVFVCVLSGLMAKGQTLEGVQVHLSGHWPRLEMRETLTFAFGEIQSNITLKALQRTGVDLSEIVLLENDRPIAFDKSTEKGLLQIKTSLASKSGVVVLHYVILCDSRNMDLPLFFTEFAASSSEDDFFSMTMEMPATVQPFMHFPTVDLEESMSGANKVLTFQLPALPSMIRMELLESGEPAPIYTQIADGLVILVFVLSAALIWTNRKRLFHG